MKRWCLLAILLSLPIMAGLRFTAETTVTTDGQKPMQTSVTVAVEGDKARIDFSESDNPTIKKGGYLVTQDAGETMFMVNPEDKTYMEWNMSQLMSMAGAMGNMVKISFTDAKVEKLEESDGGTIMGYATQRYKFKTSYNLEMKIMGMRNKQGIENEQESWTCSSIKDAGMRAWLRNAPVTGIEGLDTLMEESMKAIDGFPLVTKTKTVTRQYNRKGNKVKKTINSVSEMKVTKLEEATVDASVFVMPEGYEKVDLLGGEESPLKGIFNRKN